MLPSAEITTRMERPITPQALAHRPQDTHAILAPCGSATCSDCSEGWPGALSMGSSSNYNYLGTNESFKKHNGAYRSTLQLQPFSQQVQHRRSSRRATSWVVAGNRYSGKPHFQEPHGYSCYRGDWTSRIWQGRTHQYPKIHTPAKKGVLLSTLAFRMKFVRRLANRVFLLIDLLCIGSPMGSKLKYGNRHTPRNYIGKWPFLR